VAASSSAPILFALVNTSLALLLAPLKLLESTRLRVTSILTEGVREGVLEMEDINQLTELRMIRNTQVHSTAENIDKKRIELGVELAEALIKKLKG
jgi:hypothetical protein